MRFEFATATRIIFGGGTVGEVPALAGGMGGRAFVLTGRDSERAGGLIGRLRDAGMDVVVFGVCGEPTVDIVREATERARAAGSDVVIGIGGGSVLDAGKAVAAMLRNGGEVEDYLEVVGKGMAITERAAAFIAIPTTAGTGAEVTCNAVIGVPEHKVKVSMRSPLMLARVAVVDPELTVSMGSAVTASTGLDALTQLMEAYVSNKANPLTDGICREGLGLGAASLQRAYEDGGDLQAREGMAVASLFGGLALANAKLGAVHGFAGPLGGMTGAPHGVICARLLPHVMRANVDALRSREPESPALARYDELAAILTGESAAKACDGVVWVRRLCDVLEVPALAEYGFTVDDIGVAVGQARKSSSMKGNPIELTEGELTAIMRSSV